MAKAKKMDDVVWSLVLATGLHECWEADAVMRSRAEARAWYGLTAELWSPDARVVLVTVVGFRIARRGRDAWVGYPCGEGCVDWRWLSLGPPAGCCSAHHRGFGNLEILKLETGEEET